MATAERKPKPLDPAQDFENPVKKQEDLPGMENRGIPELEEAARKYAVIRDKRMALNDAEVKLQDILLALLKKHGKREYRHGGLEIWIKVEVEKAKVRIHDEDEAPSEKEKVNRKERSAEKSGVAGEAQGTQPGAGPSESRA